MKRFIGDFFISAICLSPFAIGINSVVNAPAASVCEGLRFEARMQCKSAVSERSDESMPWVFGSLTLLGVFVKRKLED